MKLFSCLVLFAISVSALPFEPEEGRIHGETGWYVPQLDGTFEWIDLEEGERFLEETVETRLFNSITHPVKYYLYTKANPKKGQKITDSNKSITNSNFNPLNPTRFVIHGWTQGYKAGMNKKIRDAWLSRGDFNVIVVDWARARAEYATSVLAVPTVGKKVGGMIDYLAKSHNMSLNTLHVIGHSLGAHVSGYAGKNVKSGQIHTIVGLDPALPLFSYKKTKKRLADTDAFYVETIQTNGGGLGFLEPIGKGSFYPNGGQSQPGCPLDLTGACAHARSCTYYAESVERNNFPTIHCESYKDAVNKDCGATYSSIHMGSTNNPYIVSGDYFVPVNSKAPFGMES